jgi:phosphotransacetylase
MKRLILAVPFVAILAVSACSSSGRPEAELSQEAVCLAHNENDPAQRDRCRVDASIRSDTAPDASPHQLPLRTGQIGD